LPLWIPLLFCLGTTNQVGQVLMNTDYRPLLAIITGLFEVGVAGWAVLGPGRRNIVRPTVALLLLLAGYQFAEVFVCMNTSEIRFARVAFMDIIFLPPTGLWLLAQLGAQDYPKIRRAAGTTIGLAGLLATWVWVDPTFVTRSVCEVILARYVNPTPLYPIYAAFYMLGLGAMLIGASLGMAHREDPLDRQNMADIQIGTILFVVPGIFFQILFPKYIGTSPSMMCHFAAFLGIALWHMLVRERRWALAHSQANAMRSVTSHLLAR